VSMVLALVDYISTEFYTHHNRPQSPLL